MNAESPKRFLFTAQPAVGHIQPMLPVARALQAAGHAVAFASGPSIGRWQALKELRFFPVGIDWLGQPGATQVFPELAPLDLVQATAWFQQVLFADRAARAMTDGVIQAARHFEADVIVRETWDFAGCLAAEILGLPHAMISAAMSFDIWQESVSEQLHALRADLGLPPDPELRMLHRYLSLDLVPPSLQFPNCSYRSVRHAIGISQLETKAGASLPDWFHDLPRRPTIYVTAGTVFNEIPGYFSTILDALSDEDINVVATVGKHSSHSRGNAPMNVPTNARVVDFIPQHELLPHCAMMICHGGFNTVCGALAIGTPLVVVPMAADQGQNAVRVAAAGAGLVIPFHPSVARFAACSSLAAAPAFSAVSIREAVRAVLNTASFAREASSLARQIAALPDCSHAANLLVGLAQSKKDR